MNHYPRHVGEPFASRLKELHKNLVARPQLSEWRAKKVRAQIRLERMRHARFLGRHSDGQWNAVLKEVGYRCVKCGCTPFGRPTKDHIVPVYLGGCDCIHNLQPLCRECNAAKGHDTFNWIAHRREHGFDE